MRNQLPVRLNISGGSHKDSCLKNEIERNDRLSVVKMNPRLATAEFSVRNIWRTRKLVRTDIIR